MKKMASRLLATTAPTSWPTLDELHEVTEMGWRGGGRLIQKLSTILNGAGYPTLQEPEPREQLSIQPPRRRQTQRPETQRDRDLEALYTLPFSPADQVACPHCGVYPWETHSMLCPSEPPNMRQLENIRRVREAVRAVYGRPGAPHD